MKEKTVDSIYKSIFQPILFVGLMALCGISHAGTVADDARSVAWTTANVKALERVLPDRQVVGALVRSIYGDVAVEPNVGEFLFVDLHNDGHIALVATLDFSGRGFYTRLLIVTLDNGSFKTQEITTNGASLSDLKSRVVDLDSNGQKQFLVPRLLAPYSGATPVPTMTDVYAWNGMRYGAADNQYQDYYRNTVLPRLLAGLDGLEKGLGTAGDSQRQLLKAKYKAEIEAVNQVLGQ
jgi:hypothetical protein